MSELVCLSVSHDTAPVAWRERLAVPAQTQGAVAAALVRAGVAGEALMLATCGRVDTYAVAADGDRAEAALLGRLARRAGVTPEALTPYVQALRGAAAERHVMRTAAGLESPVLGEPEILGQLRRAHDRARRAGVTAPVLDRLVRDALRAGRRAREGTSLASGAVSLSSIATGLARTLVGDTAGGRALVVGATRTARGLRARLLADGWAVTSVPSVRTGPALAPLLASFDVVASASGTRARALRADAMVDAATPRRRTATARCPCSTSRSRATSTPAPATSTACSCTTSTSSAPPPTMPSTSAGAAFPARRPSSSRSSIASRPGARRARWSPTIKALRAHVRRTAIDALGDPLGSPHDHGPEVEQALERLVTHLLHAPTRRLRDAAAEGAGNRYAELPRDLFGLHEDAGEERPPPSVSGPPARDADTGSVTL
jgi:glutamyl-tRNA reductase